MREKGIELLINIRNYNGSISVGSILERKIKFNIINSNKAMTTCILRFSLDENQEKTAICKFTYDFLIDKNEKEELIKILEEIKKDKKYKYNESHYKKEIFDINYLNYMDIIINNENYEAKFNDELILNLRKIINFKIANNAVYSSYNFVIDNIKNYK